MKHFQLKDNGCPCLDCRKMFDNERWYKLTSQYDVEVANNYSEETQRILRTR